MGKFETLSIRIERAAASIVHWLEMYEAGNLSAVGIVPQEILDSGTTSVMVLRISGRHTGELYGYAATGREVWFPAVAIYRCTDDCTKVRHETLAYDTGFVIAQIDGSTTADIEGAVTV